MYQTIVTTLISILLLFTGCQTQQKSETKFYGNIDIRTVSLAFQVSGRIDKLNFDEGQKLQKGDVIATLDNALYTEYLKQTEAKIEVQKAILKKLEKGYRKEEIAKAKAAMEEKKIVMQNKKSTLHRYNQLVIKQAISQEAYDAIKTAYQSANELYLYAQHNVTLLKNGYEVEDIDRAKAELNVLLSQKNQNKIHLDETTLYAPTNGTLITRVYEVGSVVNASQVVAEMAQEDKYWVRSYLSESYLGKIKKGMKALIYTDSNPSKPYEGEVSFISPLAEFTPKNVETETLRTDLVYRFRIVLTTYDEGIKQGMPVTIRFPDLETSTK